MARLPWFGVALAGPPPRPGARHHPARDGGDAPVRPACRGDAGEVMAGLASVIGLLHPGEMGSAVGATLVAGGSRGLWASVVGGGGGGGAGAGRGGGEPGLGAAGTLERLARRAEVIVSVAPPHAAVDVA